MPAHATGGEDKEQRAKLIAQLWEQWASDSWNPEAWAVYVETLSLADLKSLATHYRHNE